ncbi:uncharacterized protein VICG_00452 [Vittaforma corneae ATCC 50505]|uniref:Uncharacterized protein n=1 Tax=Vittaforma corneae (strain ATCC 50505) TaxID=993615 RepID=L2GNZ8_VITCO|nr:uncharacterized protein VICG_00452 [Vittaforma corneae ATCC 50505]ELA42354.1 hypothetical protein VICG_00452 [Vittaforma corneae ATCC 50505]
MFFQALKILFAVFIFTIMAIVLGVITKELIQYFENSPYAAKNAVKFLLYLVAFFHLPLFLKLPFKFIILNLLGQILYISLFGEYPNISTKDARFVAGTMVTIYNHFYFTSLGTTKSTYGAKYIAGYVVIWMAPMILYLALSANQNIVLIGHTRRRSPRPTRMVVGPLQFKRTKSPRRAS